ncbi:MAG TPA: hypothetical protein VN957_16575 [Chthoniobacterales bacterium]|nr:hypothetical protein [Chthoniobacterales bacterium]
MSAFVSVHPGRRAAFDKSPRSRLLLCLSAALFCSSCNQSNIAVYRIPKESVAIETGSGSLAPAPPSMLPKWTVPPDWKEQPLSEMRLASFKAEGSNGESADISISSFPGDAGGLESNINRWRGQVHQADLDEESLAKTMERSTVDGVPVVLVDVRTPEGTQKPDRIIGAVLRTADRTWFVKMTGSPATLQAQAENFKQFVNSFRFSNQADTSNESIGSGKSKSTNDK